MPKNFMITRPQHEYSVTYLSYWAQEIINFAKSKNIKFKDFKDKEAVKKNVESYLKKKNPSFTIFNGHGGPNEITGHQNKSLITGDKNEDLLKSKITYAIACDAAEILGEKVANKGGSFIGYKGPFCFVHDANRECNPNKDKLAEPFKNVSNKIIISILKGNSIKEAVKKSKRLSKDLIKKYSTSDAEEVNKEIRFWLFWNMNFLKILGKNPDKF